MGWLDAPVVDEGARPNNAPKWADAPEVEVPAARATASSTASPANAGMANLIATLGGLPADTIQNIINLAKAGYGSAATALGRSDLAPDLTTNIPGGSERLKSAMRSTGIAGLNPDNPNPGSEAAKFQYDFTSRGGFIPGGFLSTIGSIAGEKLGGPVGAMIGALAPSAVKTGINEVRAPRLAQQQQQNVVRDATLREAREAGYVVPPSATRSSLTENVLESVAGKSAIKQEAALRNSQVTNQLAAKALGLPENTAITDTMLNSIRYRAAQPYRDLAAVSPRAKLYLEELQAARSDAKLYWQDYFRNGQAEKYHAAKNFDTKAEGLERKLEIVARSVGKQDLLPAMRQSRVEIAKAWDVEKALNMGDAGVSARILGRMLDRGRPLSGELKTIAKFAEGPGKQFTAEASATPAPGVSYTLPLTAGILGYGGVSALGGPGLALAAAPLLRPGARKMLLSDWYQDYLAQPKYGPLNTNTEQSLIRAAALANER
jgi:hypothetical protein